MAETSRPGRGIERKRGKKQLLIKILIGYMILINYAWISLTLIYTGLAAVIILVSGFVSNLILLSTLQNKRGSQNPQL